MDETNVQKASERIRKKITKTPLLNSDVLDQILGNGHRLFFKCENFQITRSYKPRGALNALIKKSKVPTVARSSGNFAQALAWAGKQLKVPVTVVMPNDIARMKIKGTKRWGAEVILTDPSYEAQKQAVDKLLHDISGSEKLSPYDDLDIIEGQGTVALEAMEQAPKVAHFLGPIGGGGLMSGCAAYIKETDPQVQVIGVEPIGASDYYQSRGQGKKVTINHTDTIAEGLRTPCVGENNWPLLNRYVDDVKTVPDEAIVQAMKLLFEHLGIVVEPSGATACGALLNWKPTGDVVVVISGGNIDPEKFISLVQ